MLRTSRLATWVFACLAFQLAVLSLLTAPQQAWADEYSDCAAYFTPGTADYNNCIGAYDAGCPQCMGLTGDDYLSCMNDCNPAFAASSVLFGQRCLHGYHAGCL